MKHLLVGALFALAACGQPADAPKAATETAPAEPVITETTPLTTAQLVDCGGALAASGNIEIAASGPTGDTPEENRVWTVLALLDKEPGYTGDAAKGRADVAASRDAWKAKPKEDLAAAAAACTVRFPN